MQFSILLVQANIQKIGFLKRVKFSSEVFRSQLSKIVKTHRILSKCQMTLFDLCQDFTL